MIALPGILLMGFVMCLSSFFSIDWPTSVFGVWANQYYGILPMLLCLIVYYAAARSNIHTDFVINCCIAVSIPIAIISVLEIYYSPKLLGLGIFTGRAGSTLGGPLYLGAFMSLVIPCIFNRVKISRWYYVPLTLCWVSLFMAKSRGGIMAALAGMAVSHWI